mgnify:CR=1 FL=1
MKYDYTIISTIKDEPDIVKVIISVAHLMVPPQAWYIFYDGIDVYFLKKLLDYKRDYEYLNIKVFTHTDFQSQADFYYTRIANNLNFVYSQITEEDKNVNFIMKLDGDTILFYDYVDRLYSLMQKENLGCVSGRIQCTTTTGTVIENRDRNYSIGTGMLIKPHVLEYLGGYPNFPASDTIINIAANYLGYTTKQVDELMITQTRLTCGNSRYNRTLTTAIKQYYLRYPLPLVLLLVFRRDRKNLVYLIKILFKIKNEQRFNNKELIRFNNRNVIRLAVNKFIKKIIKKI